MARMIPETYDTAPCPHSERTVFDCLKAQLSDEWTVFHSLAYFGRDSFRLRWDGEIDFLLYHPEKGLLIIEVKGGDIAYRGGQWFQDGRPIDPFKQARRNKHALRKFLQEALRRSIPLKFADAVCFPACTQIPFAVPPEAKDVILGAREMANIAPVVERLLDETQLPPDIFGEISEKDILGVLAPEFEFGTRLADRILENEEKFFRLTQEQCALLGAMRNFKRLQICGCAGSGKTVMAIKKARALAENGDRVLLLCYNRLLAKRLQRETQGTPRVLAVAFFDFCVEKLRIPQAEMLKYAAHPDLYSKALPRLLQTHIERVGLCYDAVIVDEGQDFSAEAWRAIASLPKLDGAFYIFYDPDQNIFEQESPMPDFGSPPILLSKNCRNTQKIFQALKPMITLDARPYDGAPVGTDVRTLSGDSRALLATALAHLTGAEGVSSRDIVVLGAHALAHTSLGDNPRVGAFVLVADAVPQRANEIAYHTYMKFKGCEAKVVILLDVDDADERWQNRCGRYTAMSRATHQLILLHRPPAPAAAS